MMGRNRYFYLGSAVVAAILVSAWMAAHPVFATTVTWTAKAQMANARTWLSAAVYDGKIYAFGGLSGTNKLGVVERYNPVSDTWETRTPMPTARYGTSAVTLNDKIYVIGGANASSSIQKLVEVYDPVADTWATAASMPTARTRFAAVVLDGKIYAIGGSTNSTLGLTGYTTLVDIYNPSTDSWTAGAAMSTSRVGHAAAVSGGKIYVFGGYGVYPGYLARHHMTVEVYDPNENTWSSAPSMDEARYGLAAVATSNGLIYLLGGQDESSLPSYNEVYDPATGSTNIAGLLSGQRSELAAVSVQGGAEVLYAVGGGGMWFASNALDAGAIAGAPVFTHTPTPTTYPPSAIGNLAASAGCASGSVLLSWSAPGGNGNLGTASSFLVRYATEPITSISDWNSAVPVNTGIPDPFQAGTPQSMTVKGLTPGTTYYFSIRAMNSYDDIAGLSNSPSAQPTVGVGEPPWTIMVYAAADNNLHRYIYEDISSLELAAHNTCVNIVVFWDGAAINDSAYLHLKFDPHMSTWATYTEGVDKWAQGEANMGSPANLVNFVDWAKTHFPAPHYALVVRDHGDGLGGMQEDDRSSDHLTIPELDQALADMTAAGTDPLDLLFMDACLMGMLEDAYQFRGDAGIYVASEYVTWSSMRSNSHHDYFYGITPVTTGEQVGEMIVNGYANWMEARLTGYQYTMASVDMSQVGNLVDATNALAASLNAQFGAYSTQILNARLATRRYWTRHYIDLHHFTENIYTRIPDAAIQVDALAVQAAVDDFVLVERHQAYMTGSHGVTIFFPIDSSSFYDPAIYDFAVGADWGVAPRQIGQGDPRNGIGWGPLLTEYIENFPGGPDMSEPPAPVAPQIQQEIFLPLITR